MYFQEPHIEFTDVDLLHTNMLRTNAVILNDSKAVSSPRNSLPTSPKNNVQMSCSKEVTDGDLISRATMPVEIKVSGGV